MSFQICLICKSYSDFRYLIVLFCNTYSYSVFIYQINLETFCHVPKILVEILFEFKCTYLQVDLQQIRVNIIEFPISNVMCKSFHSNFLLWCLVKFHVWLHFYILCLLFSCLFYFLYFIYVVIVFYILFDYVFVFFLSSDLKNI